MAKLKPTAFDRAARAYILPRSSGFARPSLSEFDLIVLGGGSGGLASAQRAAEHGARVVLLEPAHRRGERTIAFARGKPRIHVFVLDEDLGGVASCGVDLHLRDMVLGGPAQRVSRKPTDAVGHACFDVAGPGLYLATPEGVPAEASAPHRAMVLRHPSARDHDHVLKVATQRPTAKLTLTHADGRQTTEQRTTERQDPPPAVGGQTRSQASTARTRRWSSGASGRSSLVKMLLRCLATAFSLT